MELHGGPFTQSVSRYGVQCQEEGLLALTFFKENNHAVTVTSDSYVTMLQEYFMSALNDMDLNHDNVWFQQGAKAHTSRISMGFLREAFPDPLISLREET